MAVPGGRPPRRASAADGGVFHVVDRAAPRGPTWVWAQEDLDMLTVPAARTQLMELLTADDTPLCLLIHLGAECFVDLRGLRLLLDVTRRLRRRGAHLAVVAPPACVRRMAAWLELGDELPLLATALHATSWARVRLA